MAAMGDTVLFREDGATYPAVVVRVCNNTAHAELLQGTRGRGGESLQLLDLTVFAPYGMTLWRTHRMEVAPDGHADGWYPRPT